MRSIPKLAVDATVVFDNITAAKKAPRRERMTESRLQVFGAYQAYEAAAPELGNLNVVNLTEVQKEAIRHAYATPTKPMTKLRGKLLERVIATKCPFCGISESSTLDHYLPKERYPEFSIYPNNLVPCCAGCNTRKSDSILNTRTNIRTFLHPCFDAVPDATFLEVHTRLEPEALILSYRLRRPAEMTIEIFNQLQSHFTELDLADRYRRMSLQHLGEQYLALLRAFGLERSADRLIEKLTEDAQDLEDGVGKNYWLAKLYRALASNREFCDGGFEVIREH